MFKPKMSLDDDILDLEDQEIINTYYQLATLASLLSNKKVNFQSFFIMVLTDKRFNKIARSLLDIDNDYEICRNILLLDPNLAKSKTLLTFAQEYKNENGIDRETEGDL